MSPSDFAMCVLLVARILGGLFVFAFVSRQILPWSGRFAVTLGLLVFIMPAAGLGDETFLQKIILQLGSPSGLAWPDVAQIFGELGFGAILGCALGLGAATAALVGSWLEQLVLPTWNNAIRRSHSDIKSSQPASQLVSLVFLVTLFHSPFAPQLAHALGASFSSSPLAQTPEQSAQFLGQVFPEFARNAFTGATAIALPWFVAVLFTTMVIGVAHRYARWVGERGLFTACCSLAVCFMLAFGLRLFQSQWNTVVQSSNLTLVTSNRLP